MELNKYINQLQFQKYASALADQGLSDASIRRKLSSLSTFHKFLAKKKLVDSPSYSQRPSVSATKTTVPPLTTVTQPSPTSPKIPFFNRYFLIASILLMISGLGYTLYTQVFNRATRNLAYSSASSPITPNRILSFQGRLTDSFGNPISSSTGAVFKLYTLSAGGTELYTSGAGNSQTVIPDENGIFSVVIGKTHGLGIPSSVFSENAEVWLEITAGGETMNPRQQIATVGYALNSETLQGLPPSASGFKNTVLVIDGSGNLNLGETSPTIYSQSGTLGIIGQALLIGTSDGSGGNITINPDGAGKLKILTEGTGSTATGGFIEATNANLATGNLYSGYINNDNRGYNFIDFSNYNVGTTTLASRFSVSAYGNLTAAGTINTSIGITTPRITISVGSSAGYILSSDASGNASWMSPASIGTTYDSTNGITKSSNVFKLGGQITENTRLNIGNTEVLYIDYTTGKIGVGTTSVGGALTFAGIATTVTSTPNKIQLYQGLSYGFGVSNGSLDYQTAGVHNWYTTSTIKRMTLDGNGNLGIGTTNISAKLQVLGSGSSNIAIFDGSGNVGIGTTAPTAKLEINGNIGLQQDNYIGYPNSQSQAYTPYDANFNSFINTTKSFYVNIDSDNNDADTNVFAVGKNKIDGSTTGELFRITEGGNVGIGNTNPTYKLDVNGNFRVENSTVSQYLYSTGDTVSRMWFGSDTDNNGAGQQYASITLNRAAQSLSLSYGGGGSEDHLNIRTGGNVGIGTTAPSKKLDVAGDINLSGTIFTAGTSGTSGYVLTSTGTGLQWVPNVGTTYTFTNGITLTGSNVGLGGTLTSNTIINTGSNSLSFLGLGNSQALYIGSSGYVGIGTTNPQWKLDIVQNINNTADGRVYNANSGSTAGAAFSAQSNVGILSIASLSSNYTLANLASRGALIADPTTPVAGIDIVSSSGTGDLRIYTGGYTAAAERFRIDATGNVGIGNTNPTYKLDVNGNVKIGTSSAGYDLQLYASGSDESVKWDAVNSRFVGTDGGLTKFYLQSKGSQNDGIFTSMNAAGTGKIAQFGDSAFNIGSGGLIRLYNTPTWALGVDPPSIANTEVLEISSATGSIGINPSGNATAPTNQILNINWAGNSASNLTAIKVEGSNSGGGNWYAATFGGNVGIGTTAPSKKLDVTGDINLTGTIFANGTSGTSGQILTSTGVGLSWIPSTAVGTTYSFTNGLTNSSGTVGLGGTLTSNTKINTGSNSLSFLGLGNTQSIFIGATGYIGIGTTNPQNILHLNDSGANTLRLQLTNSATGSSSTDGLHLVVDNTGDAFLIQREAQNLRFYTNNLEALRINSSGSVGIGTTNPSKKLDVAGDINLTGTIFTAGTSGTSGYVLTSTGTGLQWVPNVGTTYTFTNGITLTGSNVGLGGTLTSNTIINTGSNSLSFLGLGNSQALYIGSSGYVGVGTTDPQYKFDVASNSIRLGINSSDTTIYIPGSGATRTIYTNGDGLFTNGRFQASDSLITLTSVRTPTISSQGNNKQAIFINENQSNTYATIGIGISAIPASYQTIISNSIGTTNLTTLGLRAVTGQTGYLFAWEGVGGTNFGVITAAGNVGIGTTNPSKKLDITGDINLTGTIFSNGTSGTSGQILTSTGVGLSWVPSSSVGATYTFINGLTNTAGSVGLGGTLTQNTQIGTSSFDFNVYGLGGTKALSINSLGYVGIGTNSQAVKLQVSGIATTGYAPSNMYIGLGDAEFGANTTRLIGFGYKGNYYPGYMGYIETDPNGSGGYTIGDLVFGTRAYADSGAVRTPERMRINSDGKVGIGITSPRSALHVVGAGSSNIAIFDGSGNVGIGTTAPSKKLDIAGDINLTGTIFASGASGSSGQILSSTGTGLQWISGAGSTYTFTNGLTNTAGTVRIGGTLTQNTEIGTSSFSITIGQGATQALYISPGGSIGVGTNIVSGGKFTVAGNINIDTGSAYAIGSNAFMSFRNSNALILNENSTATNVGIYGNLGIGTTAPSKKLDVVGDINLTGTIFANGTSGSSGQVLTSTGVGLSWVPTSAIGSTYTFTNGITNTAGTVRIGGTLTQNTQIGTSSFHLDFIGLGGTQSLHIDESGNVGIGTTASSYKLNVNGDALISTRLGIGSTNPLFAFNVGGTSMLADIFGTGSLAIGTTAPTYRLELVGSNSLLRIGDTAGNTLVDISETNAQFNLPTTFTSAGDVNMANDLNFNNQTASTIRSNAPLYLEAGESFENNDLTLHTFNLGNVVLDTAGLTLLQAQSWTLASGTTNALNISNGLISLDSQNSYVGIGTTAPTKKLSVGGDINLTGTIFANGTSGSSGQVLSSTGTGLQWVTSSGTTYAFTNGLTSTSGTVRIGGTLTQNTQVGTSSFSLSFLGLGNSQALFIGNSGYVGIGTTNPAHQLHVSGTVRIANITDSTKYNNLTTDTNGYLNADNFAITSSFGMSSGVAGMNSRGFSVGTGAVYGFASATNQAAAFDVGFSRLSAGIVAVGNGTTGNTSGTLVANFIGIGTTAPSKKLDVAGDINLTGTIYANGATGSPGQVLSSTGTGLQWVTGGGVGTTYTFTNGLTNSAGIVGLGGTLTSNTQIGTSSFSLSYLGLGGSQSLYINNNGYVAIGTNNPSGPFQVNVGGTAALFVSATGNIGIGTSNPGAKLDIAGASSNITNSSGDITINAASSQVGFSGNSLKNISNITLTGTLFVGAGVTGSSGQVLASNGAGSLQWVAAGAGSTYTFTNGLTNTSGTVGLGGTLSSNTSIGTSGYSLSFLGLGNSQALFIGTSGYVGIGTTNPTSKLQLSIPGTTTNSSIISIGNEGNPSVGTLGNSGTNGVNFKISGNTSITNIVFSTNSLDRMQLTNNGDLGIGITVPNARLHVLGAGSSHIAIFDGSGNVGIGTTAPSKKLDVAGDIKLTGTIFVGAGVTGSSGQILASNGAGGLQWVNDAGGTGGVGTTYAFTNGLTNTSGTVGLGGTLTQTTQIGTSSFSLSFLGLGNSQALFIGTSGYVGLGNTSPTHKFDLYGSTNDYLGYIYNVGTTTNTAGLYVRSDGLGSLLTLNSSGSDIVTVTPTQTTFNNPVNFTSSGDISAAYDLAFTNTSSSTIRSAAPLTIQSGEVFNSSNLTLQTYNSGQLVLDTPGGVILNQAQNWTLGNGATSATALNIQSGLFTIDTKDGEIGIGTTSPNAKLHIQSYSGATYLDIGGGQIDYDIITRTGETGYGYRWYYDGSGSGNANYLRLVSENATGTAFDIFKFGHTTGGLDIYGGYTSSGVTIEQNGDLKLSGTIFVGAGVTGASGQVLSSNGAGSLQWITPSGATYTSANGVTMVGSVIGLGGSLGTNTKIGTSSFSLLFEGLGGTQALYIGSSGYVGVGTTAPISPLSVNGNITASKFASIFDYSRYFVDPGNTTSTNGSVSLHGNGSIVFNTETVGTTQVAISANSSSRIKSFANGLSIAMNIGSTGVGSTLNWEDAFFIDTSGDIGFGTTAPVGQFHIASGSTDALVIAANGSVGFGTTSPLGVFEIKVNGTGGTSAFTVAANGKVGIGVTQNSLYQLTVLGNNTSGVALIRNLATGNTVPTLLVQTASTGLGTTGAEFIRFVSATGVKVGRVRLATSATTVAYATSGANDLAEYMIATEPSDAADLMSFDNGKFSRYTPGSTIAGIHSSYATLVGNENIADQPNAFPLAISGIVKLKVSTQNGAIHQGDPLSGSNIVATASKAVKPGYIVARALQDYTNPDPSQVGTIEVIVGLNWYDPDVYLTESGEINVNHNISDSVLSSLGYTASKNEIESASYSLTDSLGQPVTRLAQFAQVSSAKIKAGLISTTNLIAKNIIAETTKSREVKTAVLTPLSDITDTIVVNGKLAASDIQTTSVTTSRLTASEATVSTLYAENIISKEGSFGQVMTDKISALREEIRSTIASIGATDPVSTPSALVAEVPNWSFDNGTSQTTITGSMSLSDNLVVGSKLSVLGDTQLGNAFITGTFTAGEVAIKENFIETTASVLHIQPSGLGSVNIMNNTLVIAENGDVTVNGNLAVTGTLNTTSLFANLINSDEINAKKITADSINVATASATPIIAESGFAALATSSASLATNATAGSATLPAGKTELVIYNEKITQNSIVYLTPVGSTNNQVVYLKSKHVSPTPTPESTSSATTSSSFVIALDQPLATDVAINWWIIN